MPSEGSLDISKVRSFFPSLSSETPYIYADNAGGSQCCQPVIDRIVDYLSNSNVQPHGDYSMSKISTDRVNLGKETAKILFNASSGHEITFGSSSTILLENLARAVEGDLGGEDEIIVTGEHEANAGPWRRLAKRGGLEVRYWHVTPIKGSSNPYAVAHDVNTLLPLITKNTRIVAITACSNILGSVVDVKSVVKQIRAKVAEKGAKKVEISVDCVAYAPHRKMDVRDWDVEYAVFSFYKRSQVYGPHIAALYTRFSTLPNLTPLTHHSPLPLDKKSYKLMPGGPGHELPYGVTGVLEYLLSISPIPGPTSSASLSEPGSIYCDPETHTRLEATFAAIAKYEHTLVKRMLEQLTSERFAKRGVRIVGEGAASERRQPTIAFVVVNGETGNVISGKDIVRVFDAKGNMGIRYGNFFAYTLDTLNPRVNVNNGLVRISLVHYNTIEEVDRLVEVLDEALGVQLGRQRPRL
ncbi:PLP-dependent transferase [Thelephora terrestris]|uniref:PLP-dependent transferase n=1 Tax=Thelephora terrestris TaxID=56493 RepID=A0A9P6HC95_9AGAM|nr:PLP-dependent transferase [Thelephora terrestris]